MFDNPIDSFLITAILTGLAINLALSAALLLKIL